MWQCRASRAHFEGIPHEGVHLWVVRTPEDGAEMLFQKRADFKESYPGCLDITVGGHVPFGLHENKVQKEAFEEIGIMPEDGDLIDLGIYRYEDHEEKGRFHREFPHVFILKDNRPLDGYAFNDGEVTAIAAVKATGLDGLMKGEAECPGEYYDGAEVSRKMISRGEFHPLLFAASMKNYMDVLFQAVKELSEEGSVLAKMSV